MLPYPPPAAIKTKLRCKFSLPGRKYNCRAMGKFIFNGKGYCAPHYDMTWKAQNPEYGQQHDWMDRTVGNHTYPVCTRCAAIKPHDGLPLSPCKGHLARIVLHAS